MKVLKRDASSVPFDKGKIEQAILKAMPNGNGVKPKIAKSIADEIELECQGFEEISIYDIERMVIDKLITKKQRLTAIAYDRYRTIREFQRDNENTIDKDVTELLSGNSEYWNNENSNKNPRLAPTMRDYMAGILSTDLTRRFLLPPNIVQAHDEGIIHFHDADYFAQTISNCCLINLEDMLQNGTCINKRKITKPHRLLTASTITTQIITSVASCQYGGTTITLTHLAPFVRDSYNYYLTKYKNRGFSADLCEKYAREDTLKEVKDAVQTFNYQINSMSTTNGQTPFISVCMYIGETDKYKEELALLIEEFLNQRIEGMPNEVGVNVTQEFPKLLYVLEEDNIRKDSKYYYLTELAAKCTAKRMVPDYISEKKMLEYKIDKTGKGAAYPCMGCRSYLTGDRVETNVARALNYNPNKGKYYGRLIA